MRGIGARHRANRRVAQERERDGEVGVEVPRRLCLHARVALGRERDAHLLEHLLELRREQGSLELREDAVVRAVQRVEYRVCRDVHREIEPVDRLVPVHERRERVARRGDEACFSERLQVRIAQRERRLLQQIEPCGLRRIIGRPVLEHDAVPGHEGLGRDALDRSGLGALSLHPGALIGGHRPRWRCRAQE
jgi:hypothetical protein